MTGLFTDDGAQVEWVPTEDISYSGGTIDMNGALNEEGTKAKNLPLINSSGAPWTADYVTVTGDLVADLLSNIASEQRAKVVYEYLYRQIEDKEVRATIDFLLNREEAHNALFREALNKVQKSGSNKDFGVTEDSKLYFDLSTPGPSHEAPNPTPPSFENPRR